MEKRREGGREANANCKRARLPGQNYKVWGVDQEAGHPGILDGAKSAPVDSWSQEIALLITGGLKFFSDPGKRTEAPVGPIH